jgi:hypothetical protein
MENSANTESRVTENLANMKSRVTENLANTENWVMQDSGRRELEEGKGGAPIKRPAPRWCPRGITKTQKRRLQKMHQRELAEKKEEEERNYWFNHLQPMTKPKQMWQKKWLAKEENGSSSDDSGEEEVQVTSDKGGSNLKLGDGNSRSGNSNTGLGNSTPGEEEDRREQLTRMDINMVLTIPTEFCALAEDVAELTLGARRAMFEKPENPRAHMKPLFIWGHLDGMSIGSMLVDGGACFNILPLSLFKKLGHVEGDLKCTNLSLSCFACDHTEAKGIICKELMVRSKTVHMAFFVMDVKGCYNMLLGRDWIHANKCGSPTLH